MILLNDRKLPFDLVLDTGAASNLIGGNTLKEIERKVPARVPGARVEYSRNAMTCTGSARPHYRPLRRLWCPAGWEVGRLPSSTGRTCWRSGSDFPARSSEAGWEGTSQKRSNNCLESSSGEVGIIPRGKDHWRAAEVCWGSIASLSEEDWAWNWARHSSRLRLAIQGSPRIEVPPRDLPLLARASNCGSAPWAEIGRLGPSSRSRRATRVFLRSGPRLRRPAAAGGGGRSFPNSRQPAPPRGGILNEASDSRAVAGAESRSQCVILREASGSSQGCLKGAKRCSLEG